MNEDCKGMERITNNKHIWDNLGFYVRFKIEFQVRTIQFCLIFGCDVNSRLPHGV